MNTNLQSRIYSANETIEMYMYMKIDGIILSNEQKKQISELLPLLSNGWEKEAIQLLR